MWLLSLFYAFVIISVSIGIGRLIPEDKILRLEGSKLFRSLALSCIIIFLVIAYLSKPMYYFPRNNGFLGDNYYHIGWVLEDGNYLKSHHILYPLLPGKLVSWSVAMGALDKQDPFFYEKAYRLAGLPVRLAVSVAMLLFSLSIFKITKSSLNALMAFFFLATSYSFWMWGLHSNAIGLAIAVSLLTFMVGANWYATGKKRSLFLLGISLHCVSLHIIPNYSLQLGFLWQYYMWYSEFKKMA